MSSSKLDLITGGTGFIGGHLATRLLREGRRVRLLCRRGSETKLEAGHLRGAELFSGDLRDRPSLRSATKDVERIFHCAGQVSDWGAREDFFAVNVRATRWLLDAAHSAGVRRFVHFSSIAAFGTPSPQYFDDETHYGRGRDWYSKTKAQGERAALRAHMEKTLPVTVLRPGVVYGLGGTWLEQPLRMARARKLFLIGGGKGTCHPCYIENLVDAALLVGIDPRAVGRAYIVSDGESVSFKEYFNAVASLVDAGPVKGSIPIPVARALATVFETSAYLAGSSTRPLLTHAAIDMVTTRSRMSSDRIRTELGFAPRYDFGSAMNELARAIRARG